MWGGRNSLQLPRGELRFALSASSLQWGLMIRLPSTVSAAHR